MPFCIIYHLTYIIRYVLYASGGREMSDQIQKAIEKAGSRALLADKAGVCYSSITHWANGTRKITRAGCIAIWNAVGVKCSDLYTYPRRGQTQG